MSSESNQHLPLKVLWTYRKDIAFLSQEELKHLSRCSNCLRALGVCVLAVDMEAASQRVVALETESEKVSS